MEINHMSKTKEDLIDSIISEIKPGFEALQKLLVHHRIRLLGCEAKEKISLDEWKRYISEYKLSKMRIVYYRAQYCLDNQGIMNDKLREMNRKTYEDSIKPNIYKLCADSKEENKNTRTPSNNDTLALRDALLEATDDAESSSLSFAFDCKESIAFWNLLAFLSAEESEEITPSYEEVQCRLEKLSIDRLELLFSSLTQRELSSLTSSESLYNGFDEFDEVYKELRNMVPYNLHFLNTNYDTIVKYYELIKLVLFNLSLLGDRNNLNEVMDELNHKRIHDDEEAFVKELRKLHYYRKNVTIDISKEIDELYGKMDEEIEHYLISCFSQLTNEKWEFFLKLIRIYQKHPTGKLVHDYLDKLTNI